MKAKSRAKVGPSAVAVNRMRRVLRLLKQAERELNFAFMNDEIKRAEPLVLISRARKCVATSMSDSNTYGDGSA